MKYILTLSLLFFSTFLIAQSTSENYSRVKINLMETNILEVAALGLETDHGVFAKGRHLINDFSEREIALLEEHGIEHEILIEDVKKWYKTQAHVECDHSHHQAKNNGCDDAEPLTYDYQTPENYPTGSMAGYLTYDEMLATLDSMYARYPDLITERQPIDTFLTQEGRPIYWLTISDNPTEAENEPEVLYDALHHAREPNSMSQMIFYMWYLLENYETDEEIQYLVNNTQMYFIPCVNPDGYIYNEVNDPNGGGLWRKNRWVDPSNGQTYGVDLNRNYGFNWGYDNNGSSPNKNSDVYRGTEAFSEPETQAVKAFCEARKIQITLNYHTFGNLLVHPWGFNDALTEDDPTFKSFGKLMTKENNYLVGTGVETVGYVVNGDSDDWMYGEEETKPKIFSLTPEAGPGAYGFWPPASLIDEINKSNLRQNLVAAHLLLNYAEVEDEGSSIVASNGALEGVNVKKYGLKIGDVTISVESASDELTIDFEPQTVSLSHLDLYPLEINYDINASTDTEVKFVVHLDNGEWSHTDTLTKQYIEGSFVESFNDSINNLDNWTTTGNWAITTNDYYSEPSSVTDSPDGNYAGNSVTKIQINEGNPIELTNATYASLRFRAKWNIEDNYDFVELSASVDGESFTALCGKYTEAGSPDQIPNSPVYDGVQNEWVAEEVSLNDFLGQTIYLKFELHSDGWVEADGFYFDDVNIEIVDSTIVPECLLVANIDTLNATQESIDLTWEGLNESIEYGIRYKLLTDDEWNETVTSTNNITLEGLNICEDYEAQVKTICNANESEYSESITFKTLCPATSLNEIQSLQGSKIYPNPFDDQFTIELNIKEKQVSLEIRLYNQLGQVFQQNNLKNVSKGKQTLNISAENIPTGIYFIQLTDQDGNSQYHKIAKVED